MYRTIKITQKLPKSPEIRFASRNNVLHDNNNNKM